MGLIPGSGRSPGEGCGNPLQYACLENPMDRGNWQATVYEVRKTVGRDLVTKQQQNLMFGKVNTHYTSCAALGNSSNKQIYPAPF